MFSLKVIIDMLVWTYLWKTVIYAGQHQNPQTLYLAIAVAYGLIVWPFKAFKK